MLTQTSAYAHLGESKEELVKRFGSPTAVVDASVFIEGRSVVIGTQLTFKSQDWTIVCIITEGRCSKSHYSKIGSWTQQHFELALNGNAQGAHWQQISSKESEKLVREWRRDDGAKAKWTLPTGMEFENPAYQRFLSKKIAEVRGSMKTTPAL